MYGKYTLHRNAKRCDFPTQKTKRENLCATALTIANTVSKNELSENHIIPILGDKRLQKRITASLTKLQK